jgi:ornithine carbamoyltransferase
MLKDLLRTIDLTSADLKYLLNRARKFKEKPHARRSLLSGESVCLYFAKPSTRSRISFETAVARLGGAPIILNPTDMQLGRGETIEDTARVVSRYARAFAMRSYSDDEMARFARAASIPVINLLTDGNHPCQSVADLLTVLERRGTLRNCRIAYLGAGNNVAVSLMEACALAGADAVIASPKEYTVAPAIVEAARAVAAENGCEIVITDDPEEASRGADVLYTDVWLSMGDAESERETRRRAFLPYQVTKRLMGLAKPDALFMHCLPAHRGEEVTEEVLEGPQSVVFDQAENRLPSSMAVLFALLERKLAGRAPA